MSEWITCSERMPAEDEPVLCWVDDGGYRAYEIGSHRNGFFTDWTHELLSVTHWIPLPAPPTE